jgi:hypothetical protein
MGFATEAGGVGVPVVGGVSAGVFREGAVGAGEFFFFDAPDLRIEI